MSQLPETFIESLKKLANKKSWDDVSRDNGDEYMDANDFSGGNFDDAYQGGYIAGQIDMAREILALLKIDSK